MKKALLTILILFVAPVTAGALTLAEVQTEVNNIEIGKGRIAGHAAALKAKSASPKSKGDLLAELGTLKSRIQPVRDELSALSVAGLSNLIIDSFSPASVKAGGTFEIHGRGMSLGLPDPYPIVRLAGGGRTFELKDMDTGSDDAVSTIETGDRTVTKTHLLVQLPNELAPGIYRVSFENSGTERSAPKDIIIAATDAPAPPPGGTTPPPVRATPPPSGTVPPPAGTTPPPSGATPPPGGVTPPPAGTTPPPVEPAPPPAGQTPPVPPVPPPAGAPSGITIQKLLGTARGILDGLIPFIIGLTVLGILWGIFNYVVHGAEEEKRAEGKKFMLYGIICLFIMLSIWGFVNILDRTFSLDNTIKTQKIPVVPAFE